MDEGEKVTAIVCGIAGLLWTIFIVSKVDSLLGKAFSDVKTAYMIGRIVFCILSAGISFMMGVSSFFEGLCAVVATPFVLLLMLLYLALIGALVEWIGGWGTIGVLAFVILGLIPESVVVVAIIGALD